MHTYAIIYALIIAISSIFIPMQWSYTANAKIERQAESVHSHHQSIVLDSMHFAHLATLQEEESPHTPAVIPLRPGPHKLLVNESSSQQDILEMEPETTAPRTLSPSPSISFQALTDSMTIIPPDTNGAVGPNHVMTMLNDRVMIQSKKGVVISVISLDSFWNTTGAFDPQLTYDPYSKRWIASTGVDFEQPSSGIIVAVSQTSDPTGVWYRLRIKGDPASTLSVDFPRLGFNSKWIVVQANMYDSSGNFNSSRLFIFNKSQAYSGHLSTANVLTLSGMGITQAPARTYDPTLQTLYLLQEWNGDSNGIGYLRLYALEGPIGSETLTTVGYPSINQVWAEYGATVNKGFAPQLNSSIRIDNGDSRMLSVMYRNGSVWGAHTAFLPSNAPTHTGVQWWQVHVTNATTQQFGRIEDTSATFNSGNFYAYPSIAVNKNNDVLVGYSQFNALMYASAAYSFRYGTDPLNTMQSSLIFAPGLDVYDKDYGSGNVRWGDYSSTVVDPSNGISLWTLQEYADTRLNGQSRWATWWSKVE